MPEADNGEKFPPIKLPDGIRSAAVFIQNSKGGVIAHGKSTGSDAGIVIINSEDTVLSHNEHTSAQAPKDDPAARRKNWYERPIGIVALATVAIIIGAALLAGLKAWLPWAHL